MYGAIIAPVIALCAWTMFIQAWMYTLRLPALFALNKWDPRGPPGSILAHVPPETRWKADNYNNLMEQPTLFYAICFALALLGAADLANVRLAWIYVILRILHSLVQCTFNSIGVRLSIFLVGSVVLLGLIVNAGIAASASM